MQTFSTPQKKLFTAFRECCKHFDKEYCFKLEKSMPGRIEAVTKDGGGATKY